MVKNICFVRGISWGTSLLMLLCFQTLNAQKSNLGTINGNFQMDAQYYREDTLIGAPDFPEDIGSNSFLNLIYSKGKFQAGVRYEAYLPVQQGFLRNSGSGLPYRYAKWTDDKFEITAGTFYEQFGSGMILRSYEEWGLGFDNSIDGFRGKARPVKGLEITTVIGRQRNAFSNKVENLSPGLIRGVDFDWGINETFDSLDIKTRIRVGASFVSRYQVDEDPIQNYPENVAAWAGRVNLNRKGFNLFAEYALKFNDPSTVNNLNYQNGSGLLVQASYSKKGLGISVQAKRIDNMDFRTDRSATFNNLNLNFLPPQTKQHTYRLATLFPYATQPLGEWAAQVEVAYKIKKGTPLGGKYGTQLTANISRIHGLDKVATGDTYYPYEADFFGMTDKPFFQDINLEIYHKFSKKFKASLTLLHFSYEEILFKQLTGFETSEDVTADIQILDMSYRLKKKQTLRLELQHALTQQEFGSWAMALVEYTIAPKYFVAVFDEYNYGNDNPDLQLHYFSGQAGVNHKTYRFTLGYGRQRAGVLCVGGVCRIVPASNGATLSVTGSF